MDLLIFSIAYPVLWCVSILPFRLLYMLSDSIFFIVYYGIGYRKKVVRSNLKLAFPDYTTRALKEIEKKFYRHLCDLFLEMIKSMSLSKKTMEKRFVFKNIDLLNQYKAQDKSVISICGHYANWEWMMSIGNHISYKGFVIYMPIANKYFDRLIKKIRIRHEITLISRKDTVTAMLQHKRDRISGIYGFASDQSPMLRKEVYWRPFMGVNVPVFTGAEVLAKKLDYVVVYLHIEKIKRGHYEASFKEITTTPKKVEDFEITNTFITLLETQIKNQPEYYFWTHKRWKHRDKMPLSKNNIPQ